MGWGLGRNDLSGQGNRDLPVLQTHLGGVQARSEIVSLAKKNEQENRIRKPCPFSLDCAPERERG
jgi:hypothetical protein